MNIRFKRDDTRDILTSDGTEVFGGMEGISYFALSGGILRGLNWQSRLAFLTRSKTKRIPPSHGRI